MCLHHFCQLPDITPSHGAGTKYRERDPFRAITVMLACVSTRRKMRMNSAWLRKAWYVQAALHLLAVGLVLGLPLAGQVRGQTINVSSVAGGSSALLGNFSADINFRQGPVPQVIEDSPFAITGYRPAGVPDSGVMVTSQVIVRDPDHPNPPGDPLETTSQAMIR
jgi:hypothetical protein